MGLGHLIDALYNLRAQRLEMSKKVDALKAQEILMREGVMTKLDELGLSKASGEVCTSSITQSTDPVANEWSEIWNFIVETERFDLVQKRLSAPAWRGLLENGILVPGTESIVIRDLSLTKAKR